MILNLGCGNDPMDGAVNHDLVRHSPHVNVAHDLEIVPWPWADDTFAQIVAQDLLEHLRLGFIAFFNECWRIMQPDGTVHIRTPMWNSPNAVIDPTHVRCYHPESFHYLDPRTAWGHKYVFYTPYKWAIESLGIDLTNIYVVLRKVTNA
jgi:hypothetical protein